MEDAIDTFTSALIGLIIIIGVSVVLTSWFFPSPTVDLNKYSPTVSARKSTMKWVNNFMQQQFDAAH